MAGPLGSAPSILLAAGLGAAASTALEPVFEPARQQAWSNNPFRVNDPATYAALVAQGGVDLSDGAALAKLHGFDADKFHALVYLAQRAPTAADAQDLRRRNKISRDQLFHAFAKEQIEHQYWDALADLVDERLSAQAVALGIIRSLIKDPGFFPVQLDTTGGVVPSYPVSSIDPISEAAASGFDEERLRVMVGSIGRPPGPGELARALFRGLIELPDFNRGILEGDTRPEWAQPFLDVNRQILTASEYAELELRGYYDRPKRLRKTAQHGMSTADSDDLFNVLGRSLPVHQIVQAAARGGVFNGPIDHIPPEYLQAMQRGNLRPEYYNMAYALRYSYESVFVMRTLVESGDLTQQEAHDDLLAIGWRPDRAATVSAAWAAKGSEAKLSPWVKAQQTRLVTAMHKARVTHDVPRTSLDQYLTPIVPDLADRDAIFQLWDDERAVQALGPA